LTIPFAVFPSQVCRRRSISFALYKLAMMGFVLDLTLDLDTVVLAVWLCSMVLVVSLTSLARRRRERLSPLRFSMSTHGSSVAFTAVALVINTAVFWSWAWALQGGGVSLMALLLVDCFLEGLSLVHTLARTGIEAYDSRIRASQEAAAAAAVLTGGAEVPAPVTGWDRKVTSTMLADFVAEAGGLLVTLLHYLHVWWIAGLNFTLLDVLLFLNCRAVFIQLRDRYAAHLEYYRRADRLRAALGAMHNPTEREVRASDEVCGIMQVPLRDEGVEEGSPALDAPRIDVVRTPCGHSFLRAQLRRWLEMPESRGQCPVCRRTLLEAGQQGPPVPGAAPAQQHDAGAPAGPGAAAGGQPGLAHDAARVAAAAGPAGNPPAGLAADRGGLPRLAVPPPGAAIGAGSPFYWQGNVGGMGMGFGFGAGGLAAGFGNDFMAMAQQGGAAGFPFGGMGLGGAAGGPAGGAAAAGAAAGGLPREVVRQRVIQVLEVASTVSPAAVERAVAAGGLPPVILEQIFSHPEAWPLAGPGEIDAYIRPPEPDAGALRPDAGAARDGGADGVAAASASASAGPATPKDPGPQPKFEPGAAGAGPAISLMRRRSAWLVDDARFRMAAGKIRTCSSPAGCAAGDAARPSVPEAAAARSPPVEQGERTAARYAEAPSDAAVEVGQAREVGLPAATDELVPPARMTMEEVRRRRLAAYMRGND